MIFAEVGLIEHVIYSGAWPALWTVLPKFKNKYHVQISQLVETAASKVKLGLYDGAWYIEIQWFHFCVNISNIGGMKRFFLPTMVTFDRLYVCIRHAEIHEFHGLTTPCPKLAELAVSHVMFAFYCVPMLRNAEVTWKNSSSAVLGTDVAKMQNSQMSIHVGLLGILWHDGQDMHTQICRSTCLKWSPWNKAVGRSQ